MPLYIRIFELTIAVNSTKKIRVTSYLLFQSFNFWLHYFLCFVLLICISTDLGGYLFGKTFKGPKLTKISPQKTYSGVLGSFIVSYFCSINYFYFFNNFFSKVSLLEISIIIVLISFVSQIGDLIISYFKRISNMKDTGQLIPGHGGILDRIDGMIFAFPLFYFLFASNISQ